MSCCEERPWPLKVIESTDSTNRELLASSLQEFPIGSALLARKQTSGRGRSDRTWVSLPGGMYVSILLKPTDPQGLALLGALVVVELLEDASISSVIRWPNDVMVGGKKIAGVLPVASFCGNALERAVVGVGLNVNQPLADFPSELLGSVTTLAVEGPQGLWDVVEVCQNFLAIFRRRYEQLERHGLPDLIACCEPYLEGLGTERQPVLVSDGGTKHPLDPIVGLGARGELRLRDGTVIESLGQDQRLRFTDEL